MSAHGAHGPLVQQPLGCMFEWSEGPVEPWSGEPMKPVFLFVALGLLGLGTSAAADSANQFGLKCGSQRLSLDLLSKRWCEVGDGGSCPVQSVLHVSPSRIDLKDYV